MFFSRYGTKAARAYGEKRLGREQIRDRVCHARVCRLDPDPFRPYHNYVFAFPSTRRTVGEKTDY